jgi:hypothetical protein
MNCNLTLVVQTYPPSLEQRRAFKIEFQVQVTFMLILELQIVPLLRIVFGGFQIIGLIKYMFLSTERNFFV